MLRTLCFIIGFPIFGCCLSYAQGISPGVPLVQNYSKSIYQAGNQNWSASCSPDGIMYFGNNDGLLEFDGERWKTYAMPQKIIIRGVATDENGLVYTGGLGQFGVWERNAFGQLVYRSISDQLPEKDRPRDEVWKIYTSGKQVLFESFSAIYSYRDGKVETLKTEDPFLFLYQAGNRFFVEIISKGLYELKQGKLEKVIDKQAYGDSRILSVLPFGAQAYLIGTAKNGIFIWDGTTFKPWLENEAQAELQQYQFNNGLLLQDQSYAFGTILNGIYILSKQGKLLQHIHIINGLQNNTVLSLQRDQQGNVWAGLDNGIDRVEINSPIYYYNDRFGSLGSVYTAKFFHNKLYIGTNQGLYVSDASSDKSYQDFNFRLIAGSQGQVWDLAIYDDELICGHNEGTFKLENGRPVWLSKITGGYFVQPLKDSVNYLIQGTYTGLVRFKRQAKGLVFDLRIANFGEPVQYLQQIDNRKFWVSGYRGLYQLELSADQRRVVRQKQYSNKEGLPKTSFVNVFDLAGRIVFATDSGFYLYDDIADHFQPYTPLNERLGSFAKANKILLAEKNNYWFIRKGHIARVSFRDGGQVSMDTILFAGLRNRMLPYYESVNALTAHFSLISLEDGFALYDKRKNKPLPELLSPLIRSIEDISEAKAAKLPFYGHPAFEIPYQRRNIRIRYALPYFALDPVEFQYKLAGNSKDWSVWEQVPQKEFTNLPHGQYTFKVRARTLDGRISPTLSIQFVVLAPWYFTFWAFCCYAIIMLLAIWIIRQLYRKKLLKHQEEVRKKVLLEQEERMKQEALQNGQQLVMLKNAQLEKELASKNRELANSAMNIVYKNELLNNIHEELLQLKDHDGKKLSTDQLKKISKIIEDARSDARDWNLFEESFNEAHENFFKKLKKNYPGLVPNDLKLCAYLRMNMSSKEIATLLNITTRGVEIRRYRLRKKLNLDHDDNLSAFLMEI